MDDHNADWDHNARNAYWKNVWQPRSSGMVYQSDMFDAGKGVLDGFQLVCPECGTGFRHEIEADIPDRNEYEGHSYGWFGRGEVTVLRLWCESDCTEKRMLIGNHKGRFEVGILKTGIESRNFREWKELCREREKRSWFSPND